MNSIVLYSRLGAALTLDADQWRHILTVGEQYGWKPAGTLQPPVDLLSTQTPAWSGDYLEARGQEVTSHDAGCLRTALVAIPRKILDSLGIAILCSRLTALSKNSGFLICELHRDDMAGDLQTLHASLSADRGPTPTTAEDPLNEPHENVVMRVGKRG